MYAPTQAQRQSAHHRGRMSAREWLQCGDLTVEQNALANAKVSAQTLNVSSGKNRHHGVQAGWDGNDNSGGGSGQSSFEARLKVQRAILQRMIVLQLHTCSVDVTNAAQEKRGMGSWITEYTGGTPVPIAGVPYFEEHVTTLMVDLPCKVTQTDLVEAVRNMGFDDTYDFLYIPASETSNRGYAYINFMQHEHAVAFAKVFPSYKFANNQSTKALTVKVAHTQGKDANILKNLQGKTMPYIRDPPWYILELFSPSKYAWSALYGQNCLSKSYVC